MKQPKKEHNFFNTIVQEELQDLTTKTVFNIHEITALYERFKFLDRKNCGFLTANELFLLPEFKANPISPFVVEFLENFNNYEFFNFYSFLKFFEIFHSEKSDKIRFLFFYDVLNQKNDGMICKNVLKFFFQKMHGEICNNQIDDISFFLIEKYKKNGNNYIDKEGLKNMYDELKLDSFFIINFQ